MKSRLPDYISVNTDPSRFGCKIWGRPSVPISSINIGTFCCLNHDRIGIHFAGLLCESRFHCTQRSTGFPFPRLAAESRAWKGLFTVKKKKNLAVVGRSDCWEKIGSSAFTGFFILFLFLFVCAVLDTYILSRAIPKWLFL